MRINAITVLPATPPRLKPLFELANNLWFSWNHEVCNLFKKIDHAHWDASYHNPIGMLCLVPYEKLEEISEDEQFLAEMESVYSRFRAYMHETTWFERRFGKRTSPLIAYLSCEYGLHESLRVYSGGLGLLAGDHLKSASDLGLPLVGVGLLYREGYFHQFLDAEGMQQETYKEIDWYGLPINLVRDPQGIPVTLNLKLDQETVYYHIWLVNIGRVKLYLLDTNLDINPPHHRVITTRLYDSDRDIRIRQELLLGLGGVRALRALGFSPSVYHVNEGHSAFLLLERIRMLVQEHNISVDEAREVVWASTVFTTHTPVAAGNERFHPDMIQKYLAKYQRDLDITPEQFMALGRLNPDDEHEGFCMTVLALKLSAFVNGVSKLHGTVSRTMWRCLYPNMPEDEIPIGSITNGVHTQSWLNPQIQHLFLRYLGAGIANELADFSMWDKMDVIPDDELWGIHDMQRRKLVSFVRSRVRWQMERRGSVFDLHEIDELLDPKILTLGFARRFATYKRAFLLFKHPDRLKRLLLDEDHPIQIVIAGKAHPADHAGKDIIKMIYQFSNQPEIRKRVVLLENYDINVARKMVQGVDLWLNTPRRPHEASGTSGMKAAMNGALNFSILDGWWDEAYDAAIGWAIGTREHFPNPDNQDNIESELLYSTLERQVIPLFYQRDGRGMPAQWVTMMKASMKRCGRLFNSHRMLEEYTTTYYQKAEDFYRKLTENNFQTAREMTRWRNKIADAWHTISIGKVETPVSDYIYKGEDLEITAWINLGEIDPQNVHVEIYHGPLNMQDRIEKGNVDAMEVAGTEGDFTLFTGKISCTMGGHYGYVVRILPGHPNLATKYLPSYIHWS